MPVAVAEPDGSAPSAGSVDLRRVSRDIYGTTRLEADGRTLWWAAHTPDGPGTLRLSSTAAGRAPAVSAWGPGAEWMQAQAPRLLGADDDPGAFRPPAGVVRDLWRRHGPVAFGRTDRVFDATLESVLGQKVQTALARRSLRLLTASLGEPAPGPVPLRLYPHPHRLAELGSAGLHRFGVERKRADTLVRVAREAERLETAGAAGPAALDARLRSVRGVGVWTSALVRAAALGDADAVPVGDFHVPHAIVWALTGRPRGSDAEMLELLEPFRPHRGRVVALLMGTVGPAPRFGPRLECLPVDHFDRPDAWFRDRSPFGGGHRQGPLDGARRGRPSAMRSGGGR